VSANFQTYALLSCGVNGTTLTEQVKMSMKRESGATLVKTVLRGLAGVSPGAAMCMGGISNVIPGAGLEFDAGQYIIGLIPVSLKFVQIQNGKGCVFQAYFMDDETAHGVGVPAGYDLNFAGFYPLWQ
jgi:hypothetical protein